jgi:hypothetical protein
MRDSRSIGSLAEGRFLSQSRMDVESPLTIHIFSSVLDLFATLQTTGTPVLCFEA